MHNWIFLLALGAAVGGCKKAMSEPERKSWEDYGACKGGAPAYPAGGVGEWTEEDRVFNLKMERLGTQCGINAAAAEVERNARK